MANETIIGLQQMQAALKTIFGLTDSQINDESVIKWIANAPVGILEYTDLLKGETELIQTARMECNQVYEGNIDVLVETLREIDDSYKVLPKWNVICITYNEINPISEIISNIANEEGTEVEEVSSKEVAMVDPETSKVIVEESESAKVESSMQMLGKTDEAEEQDLSDTSDYTSEQLQLNMEQPQENDSKENVRAEATIIKEPKEEIKMGALDNVVNEANSVNAVAAKAKQEMSEGAIKAKGVVGASSPNRVQFTRDNKIQQFVVANDTVASRIVQGFDNAMVAINPDECAKRVKTLKNNFLKAIGVPAEDAKVGVVINSPEDIMQYQNKEELVGVYSHADAVAAFKVWQLIIELETEPTKAMPYIAPSNTAYKIVGAKIADKFYDGAGLTNLILTKSIGEIFAVGAVDENNNIDTKKATKISVKLATYTKAADDKTGAKQEVKKLIPNYTKKAEFVKDPSHVVIAHTTNVTSDVKAQKTVAVTLSMENPQIGLEPIAASFQYFNKASKTGVKEVVRDGQKTYVYPKRTFKLTGKVKTYATTEAVISDLVAGGDWGKCISADKEKTEKVLTFDERVKTTEQSLFELFGSIAGATGLNLDENAEIQAIVAQIQSAETAPAEM